MDSTRPLLSDSRRILLEQRLRGRGRPARNTAIPRGPDGEPAPLSFAQQSFWVVDRLLPSSPLYHTGELVRLRGQVDEAALERSIGTIVRRHDSLRTTLVEQDGGPVQVVASWTPFALRQLNAGGQGLASALELARQDAERPLELARGPLFRACLIRIAPDDHLLLMVGHHVVMDGWSNAVLRRELNMLYAAFTRGMPSPLPELTIQYPDFARWQRRALSGQTLERLLGFWRRELAGMPQAVDLPMAAPASPAPSQRGSVRVAALPPETAQRLRELTRGGVTAFMVFLAGFVTLLSRYSGQPEIVVGSPTAGRLRPELEELIGLFTNPVVLRTRLGGRPTFREVLRRVQTTTVSALSHQEAPFGCLVQDLRPTREPGRNPLFQVMYDFLPASEQHWSLPGLQTEELSLPQDWVKFDLSLAVADRGDSFTLSLQHALNRLDGDTAGRMLDHLCRLLAAAAAEPDVPVGDLDLLPPGERQRLEAIGDATVTAPPWNRCVHELFEEQAARRPDAVAVETASERLSYRELNQQADRLAHRLRALGVRPETLVGVCLTRSADMVAAALGVLKAGGAYVPLDPDHPPGRLAAVVEDAGIEIAVAQTCTVGCLPTAGSNRLRLVLADQSEAPSEPGRAWANRAPGPWNTAYVIYTSGSTGGPKGVQVPHRSVVSFLAAIRRELDLGRSDVMAAVTTLAFDIHVLELYLPLMVGGRIALLTRAEAADGPLLWRRLTETRTTVMQATPGTWRILLDAGGPGEHLRRLLCGGESLSTSLARQLLASGAELWNLYGPTETAVWCSAHLVRVTDDPVPIGGPLDGVRLIIVDDRLEPVPEGALGELCVSGAQVAHGYLGRPGLTAQQFRPDPRGAPGSRLYRTGDLTRWRHDGAVEMAGRLDDQVKIRGYRIEPGEVEALLEADVAVRQAAVVARRSAGGQQLAAFIVPAAGPLDRDAIRARLERQLPDYLVPAFLVPMAELPVTPNGKLDRKSLAEAELPAELSGRRFVAPRTMTETLLAAVMREVLGVERVGVEDRFFEIGGDSLLAVAVASRASSSGLRVTPNEIFEHDTVAALAAALDAARDSAVPLTPAQRDVIRGGPKPVGQDNYVLLRLDAGAGTEQLRQALDRVVAAHDALRLRFRIQDGQWTQSVARREEPALIGEKDLRHLPLPKQWRALRREIAARQTEFSLASGPMLRGVLFHLGGDRLLLLAGHPLVVDAASWRTVLADLAAACIQPIHAPGPSYQAWAAESAGRADRRAGLPSGPYEPMGPLGAPALPVAARLTSAETRAIAPDGLGGGSRADELLIAAVALAVSAVTGTPSVRVGLDDDGRETGVVSGQHLSHAVGRFARRLLLILPGHDDTQAVARLADEQLRGRSGEVHGDAAPVDVIVQPSAGREPGPPGSPFFTVLSGPPPFRPVAARDTMAGLWAVWQMDGDRLLVRWHYDPARWERECVVRIACSFASRLRAATGWRGRSEASADPADFPLAGLDEAELKRVLGS